MLESRLSLQLVHSDALLQQRLHLGPYFVLAFSLGSYHRFLLETNPLLLLKNLVGLAFQVHQDLVFALYFFLLVHYFLA